MSISRMRRKFSISGRFILIIIAVIFLASVFMGLGNYLTGRSGQGGAASAPGEPPDPVARVNGENVDRATFQQAWGRYLSSLPPEQVSVSRIELYRNGALQQMAQEVAMLQAARERNVEVSDRELDRYIADQAKAFLDYLEAQAKQAKPPTTVERMIENWAARNAPDEKPAKVTRRWFRRAFADYLRREPQRAEQLRAATLQKLQKDVERSTKVTERELRDSYYQVKYSSFTFMIRPQGADASVPGFASERAALSAAEKTASEARGGADWAALAKGLEKSYKGAVTSREEGPLSVRYLGYRLGNDVVRQLVRAKVGDVVGPFKEPGLRAPQLLRVTERKLQLPAEFDRNKRTLLDEYRAELQRQAWQQFVNQLSARIRLEVFDPELEGARLKGQGRYREAARKFDQALRDFGAKMEPEVQIGAYFALGDCYVMLKRYNDARQYGYWNAFSPEPSRRGFEVPKSWLADVYVQLGLSYFHEVQNTRPSASARAKLVADMQQQFDNAISRVKDDPTRLEDVYARIIVPYDELKVEAPAEPIHKYLAEYTEKEQRLEHARPHHEWLAKYYRKIGKLNLAAAEDKWLAKHKQRSPAAAPGTINLGGASPAITVAPSAPRGR